MFSVSNEDASYSFMKFRGRPGLYLSRGLSSSLGPGTDQTQASSKLLVVAKILDLVVAKFKLELFAGEGGGGKKGRRAARTDCT